MPPNITLEKERVLVVCQGALTRLAAHQIWLFSSEPETRLVGIEKASEGASKIQWESSLSVPSHAAGFCLRVSYRRGEVLRVLSRQPDEPRMLGRYCEHLLQTLHGRTGRLL